MLENKSSTDRIEISLTLLITFITALLISIFTCEFILSFGQNQVVNVYADNQLIYTGPKYQVQTSSAGATTEINIYKGRTQFNLQKTYFAKQVEIK